MNIDIKNYFSALNENYLLIVTSNSKEKDSVNKVISNRKNVNTHLSTGGCSIGLLDGVFVIHLTGTSGVSNEKSASRLVIEFVSQSNIPTPGVVYLVGFCWGNPAKTKVGDIIIACTIYSLNSRVISSEETSHKVIQCRSSIDLDLIAQKIIQEIPNSTLGELASLETLLSSTSERDKLLKQYPHLIGGEMEAFGFVPSLRQTPWIIIKSVSDFGCDNFERSNQANAAASSALALLSLTKLLKENELISFSISKPDETTLLECLFGNEIRVLKSDVNSDHLNDYLNDKIGVVIARKLEYYMNNNGYDRSFLRYFCDLILEVIQNSLKHGGASFVSVKFHMDEIIITDDGGEYSLQNIKGDKGGALSWRRFNLHGVDKNFVSYTFKKKSHYFGMIASVKELTNAIAKCKASIIPATIGAGYSRQQILSYNNDCEVIYFEDDSIFMTSRRLTLIYEVKKLLDDGKKVYVKVTDTEYAKEYRAVLNKYSDKLVIIEK